MYQLSFFPVVDTVVTVVTCMCVSLDCFIKIPKHTGNDYLQYLMLDVAGCKAE